ncbi:hypothetical protein [Streptomyces sp. ODS28]|uniref:hypothetical protein n=1 Tax=Streptomyces sp. ODS28 TaxID=3136688 RepID=UPI0031E9D2EA
MSEPIVFADQWRAVMDAAGYRCQCAGACGSKHSKGEGRCERVHDQYADKHHGPARLLAAPVDPTLSPRAAAELPPSGLRAWCEGCHGAATRAARKAARAEPAPDQGGLFDL